MLRIGDPKPRELKSIIGDKSSRNKNSKRFLLRKIIYKGIQNLRKLSTAQQCPLVLNLILLVKIIKKMYQFSFNKSYCELLDFLFIRKYIIKYLILITRQGKFKLHEILKQNKQASKI